MNLVRNAAEAVSENAEGQRKVAVGVREEGALVKFSVIDNGPGLPAPSATAIFEPFETTKPDGLGMGLAISRTIIENHGGRLWAENAPEGGARFLFTLGVLGAMPGGATDAG